MYIVDLRHFLTDQGAIAPERGAARKMAEFYAASVARATAAPARAVLAPKCFKCKVISVKTSLGADLAVHWSCSVCGTAGRISNWQGTLWDLTGDAEPKG